MTFSAKVVADSTSAAGVRLVTMEVTFPRIILAELNTHRVFSRNSASSRAIPAKKLIDQVEGDPFVPLYWGKNVGGMQAREVLSLELQVVCRDQWLRARDFAVKTAKALTNLDTEPGTGKEIGLHKQTVNRLLEPWMWTTALITSTEWANFFALRDHPDAQPEMQHLARVMRTAMNGSTPHWVQPGQWHLPYASGETPLGLSEEASTWRMRRWSVARCARVSTLNHDGTAPDLEKDEALHDRLLSAGHMSPFEHQAEALESAHDYPKLQGNLRGWKQYRKTLPGENRGEV